LVLRDQHHLLQGLEEPVNGGFGKLAMAGNVRYGIDVIGQANKDVYGSINGPDGCRFSIGV